MNLTLAHLSVASLMGASPLFTTSGIFGSLSIRKSVFEKSFVSTVRTSLFTRLLLTENRFESFLEHPVHVDSLNYYNNTIEKRRMCLLVGPVEISYCIFRLCLSNAKGGAIFTVTDIQMKQCWFVYNKSPKGGHIYSTAGIQCASVTFEGGYSPEASGFACEDRDIADLDLYLTTFVRLESGNHSCFTSIGPGNVSVRYCNMSTDNADHSNSGFYVKGAALEVIGSILFEMRAKYDTAMVLSSLKKCHIEDALFWFLSTENGGCVSVRDTVPGVTMRQCSFISCRAENSPMILTDNSHVMISNVCTDQSKSELIGDQKVALDDMVRLMNQCDDRYRVNVPGTFGYATEDYDLELQVMRSEIADGMILGGLSILVVISAMGMTMICAGQIKQFFANRDE